MLLGISGVEIASLEGIRCGLGHGCFFTYFICVLAELSVWFDPFLSFFAPPLTISAFPFLHGYFGSRRYFGRWIFKTNMGSIPPERDGSSLPFFRFFFFGVFGRLGTTNVRVTSNFSVHFFSSFCREFILFNGIVARIRIEYGSFFGPI